jgi:signal transduction histidine kinase/ActR/RegA family two-component response regulator
MWSQIRVEVAVSSPAGRFSAISPFTERPSQLDGLARYGVAIAAVAIAAALRLAVNSLFDQGFLYITFFLALFISAWYGGFGPTLLAVVLSIAIVSYAGPPQQQLAAAKSMFAASGALFAVIGVATGWLGETRLLAFRRAEEHARKAAAAAALAEEERARAEDEASKSEEAAAEAEQHAEEAQEALRGRLRAEEAVRSLQRLESIGQLAGGVAHEVNNQMTVVLGAADFILRRDDVPAPVRVDVEVMRDAAQRSAGITAQLLAFGRRQILRPEVVDISAVVEEFRSVLKRTMGEKYDLTFDLAPDAGRVRADRRQLEQVMLNLALNAADAMPEGGRLSIRTSRVELSDADPRLPLEPVVRPGPYVEVAVTDVGSGMDQATLERVFEPFFTTKGTGKGTGLGLSTVYGIVRQSGGYIAAHSVLAQGTTFDIYLPVTGEPMSPSAPVFEARDGGGHETILVVEDQPEVRQMAVRALHAEGYSVVEAADGVDALALVRNGHAPVDLVITDLALPRLDGLGLARELTTVLPGVPVLFMTGYTNSESMRRTAQTRGHPFLEKPFTADELARRARAVLDARGPIARG